MRKRKSKDGSALLIRDLARYQLETRADNLIIYVQTSKKSIIKQAAELRQLTEELKLGDSTAKKAENVQSELEQVEKKFVEEIEKIKASLDIKSTEEDIHKKMAEFEIVRGNAEKSLPGILNNLKLIISDVKKQVPVIESQIEERKKLSEKVDKIISKAPLYSKVFFAIFATLNVYIVAYYYYSAGKIYEPITFIATMTIGIIVTFVQFNCLLLINSVIIYIISKIFKEIKTNLLITLMLILISSIIFSVLFFLNVPQWAYTNLLNPLTKFIRSTLELDPASLMVALLGIVSFLQLPVDLYQRFLRVLSKLSKISTKKP